jgi:alpha-L-rhamnosidase
MTGETDMIKRAIKTIRAFGLLVALGANGYAAGDLPVLAAVPPPAHLLCERAKNPVIDVAVPALSWKLTDTRSGAAQTAYRILVASSPEQLASEQGDLWDSGRVESDQSLDVAYAGKPLNSRQQAFWKVKVWDQDGQESPWSEPASWRMALLDAKEWQASWIAAPAMTEPQSEGLDVFLDAASMSEASKSLFRGRQPELLFRRTFDVPQEGAADAIVRVCGLGAFNLFINGQRIGDSWLDPISSDYREVAYYKTFDITQYLRPGENVVAIEVADGWYGQGVVWLGYFVFGSPKLLAEVEWVDRSGKTHSFGTEAGWKVRFGPTLRSNIYGGEMKDARLEPTGWMLPGFDDSEWSEAVETEPGSPRLVSQVAPSIKDIRRIQPVARSMPKPGVTVFDFGEHFSGVARLRIRDAKPGQTVTVQFGDFLSPDGRVNHSLMNPTRVRQTLTYVCRGGDTEEWTPTFTYFGFRYAEVTGLDAEPAMDFLEGVFLSTEVEQVGEFACSLELYNKMHRMAVQTLQSNIHGILTDCPHREKCGWLGDVWMSMHTWLMNFDITAFNRKFIEDIRLTYQPMGLPSDIAGGKRQHRWTEKRAAPLDWMAATVIYPYLHYVYTADRVELERHYPYMKRFADTAIPLVRERYASGDLKLTRAQPFFLGDWGDTPADGKRQGDFPLFPAETPALLSGTQTMIHTLHCLAASAEMLGHPNDRKKYTAMANELIGLANQNYFDAATASYGSQSANAWAYKLGMVPEDSREAFVQRFAQEISEVDQIIPTYGMMGLVTIFQSLTEAGHGPMVHALADAKADRGFRRLIERGATTLWEFQGRGEPVPSASGNHPPFSGYDAWFYSHLCGIRPDPAFPGFKRTLLKPWFDPKVEWAKASHNSPHGVIRSEWKRQPDGSIEWNITVPPNTIAVAEAPQGYQFENAPAQRELASGTYKLKLKKIK